jgi:hypothetical protein
MDKELEKLVSSGAVCEKCGGLHYDGVDDLILILAEAEQRRVDPPQVCGCFDCPGCGERANQVKVFVRERIAESQSALERSREERLRYDRQPRGSTQTSDREIEA